MLRTRSRVGALSLAALTSLTLAGGTLAAAASPTGTGAASGDAGAYARLAASRTGKDLIKLDLLAINDFHGNLEVVPPTSSSGRINSTPAGGAAYLASLLHRERVKSRAAGATPHTVAAGDL